MNRAIWSDPETSNTTKLDCLKWSNELAHRVWSLLFELKKGIDERSENALAEQIDFYRKQSDELAGHLAAALRSTVAQLNRLSLDTL